MADFLWRRPDGSEVLAHWHTYGYGRAHPPPGSTEIIQAWVADSRERDIQALSVHHGAVRLDVERYLTTIPLITTPAER